jgi:hypothetical protein
MGWASIQGLSTVPLFHDVPGAQYRHRDPSQSEN